MQFSTCKGLVALLGLSSSVAAAPSKRFDPGSATDAFADLQSQALQALGVADVASDTLSPPQKRGSCHLGNAYVRKDWKWLSDQDKTAYINAVLCLQKKPSKADPSFAPGARTRYDDFVAVHLNQTLSIHGTGNFLTWHRYFTWAYENALRQECGYSGSQPYWNWFDGSDFANSPVFDGSATSMSGDGAFVAHNGSVSGSGNIYIPSGNGGGCLKDGPFKDMIINLGPVSPGMDGMKPGPDGGLGYNPRCLLRDLSTYSVDTTMTLSNLANVTVGSASHSILAFQNELQGRFSDRFLGMHAAGHFTMGGEASDLFTSPNDPVFFLHHSMVDHLYFIWQALQPHQARDIAGTITILNRPPSRDALKSDILNMGTLAPSITIDDALSTFGGPFCYYYI
ncbi:uncharacterized protein B0I36DRAFT_332532 [Microdochium trichocladiopsis]|uniref:Tyrosinase copper-binding domain-containing protein n=1 Tax=Microdochium trichocladiopsis TaxID=1682393 RepID=A0A9P9BJD1_9PEZI|nr:uncharacterized protein B0I36DRAFT_332532 [Microdochium trichocladiopsis]KAH7025103.1 hypothetical protein B0I36DRAFT_332532 [Microdochium trichocladiopsis]